MKIALAQINTVVGDVHGNRDLVLKNFAAAKSQGADLVVFPELCLTGYPPRDLLGVHGFVDASLTALNEIALQTERTGIIIGFVDRNTQKGKEYFNGAALLAEGGIQAIVHKTLLPTYDVFDEGRYFEKAKECAVVPFQGRRLGISICEDAWNSEGLRQKPLYSTNPIRRLVQKGADLLINVSASPFEIEKPESRYRLLLDHVRKYKVPFLYVNLVGGNDDLLFDGNSLVLGSKGNLIAQAKSFAEDLLLVDPDADTEQQHRSGEITEMSFQALVMGTKDYARKCGFKSAVLGLSGGIDSAVTACIAAAALGPENVLGVAMPSVYSAPESYEDAWILAKNLGIAFQVIPIQSVMEEYNRVLSGPFAGFPEDTTEENLQARIRGNLLMALSNKCGHLLLSTGNKSELGVGYCTLYGDMAGGLAVISDVTKNLVYRLADYINREREIIPSSTILRPPTAELRPNQRDQDSLPDYDVLDGILRLRVEQQMSPEEIMAQGYDSETVRMVIRMLYQSEYKRRQAAPGLKVSSRAFGTGRRMPIAMRLNY